MSENVITSNDVAPKKVPTSFSDLKKEELVRVADYFGSESSGTAKVIVADLVSSGVTFEQYLEAFHPEAVKKNNSENDSFPPDPLPDEEINWVEPAAGGEEVSEIKTVLPSPKLEPTEKYLIRFIGENPYFEFGKYKFTQDKPYGIMTAEEAQSALVNEPTKFRQAYPAELQEFYG